MKQETMKQEMMNPEVQQRIFSAANKLYEQNSTKPPSVISVRRIARVNMNDASDAMRIWRKEKNIGQDNKEDIPPESVQQIGDSAIASIWQKANQIATESLRAAQSTWESEREELTTMVKEISLEYDAEVNKNQELSQQIEMMKKKIDDANKKNFEAEHKSIIAESLKDEIKQRAKALQLELEHAHKENTRLRNEREQSRIELSKANELTERLSGRLDVLEKIENKNSRKK